MTSFLDLARQVESLAPPTPDVATLVARGERELHRRRVAAVVTAAAVVVVMIAGGVLVGGGDPDSRGPIEPTHRHDRTPAPTLPKVRQIAYADGLRGRSIHFGTHEVRTGIAFTQIDVTDDGFLFSTGDVHGQGNKSLWFSDGGSPVKLSDSDCGAAHGFANGVVTGTSGSRAVWLECPKGAPQSLVVFNTSSMREVVRQPLEPCEPQPGGCSLEALIGDDVYLVDAYTRHPDGPIRTRGLVLDLTTSSLTQVSTTDQRYAEATDTQAYIADVRSLARGLVVGESPQTGQPTDGIGLRFSVVGATARLVPDLGMPNGDEIRGPAWSIATGRQVQLRLPPGYDFPGRADTFSLFEWLDDDTVALLAGGGGWDGGRSAGDILTCRLSDGRCRLAVRGPAERTVRVVPNLDLPG
ncbi:hypothetical protein [Nocardioides pocheonensis]|uniref:Uncharacterized protein n=1 Tax=Nocardioides pocheonensis TaxID=661485 RepID=A0A3N0GWX8_9ACTN|nr:hypothetical protein [Nocardioides pocheonensis]RNM16592.1 hypothetical protein EFL26_03380 [Nocardioides pocheonensis]